MNRRSPFHSTTRRWAIIIAGDNGYFWDFVKRAPYVKDRPYLFPNEASAKAYAAWKLAWAAERNFPSTKKMVAINVDDFDFSSVKLSWPEALDNVRAA